MAQAGAPSAVIPPGELSLHNQITKYRWVALIGRGGMGEVYLAVVNGPAGFKKLVVVKVLRVKSSDDEHARKMFLDEGRLAARLNHQNVVQTHEVGEADGVPYMAMEYLEGQPLSKIIRALGPLEPRVAAAIVSSVLAGLHYAHELQDFDGTPLELVHRDLSPPNIFLTYDGVVKLVDFGIAKTTLASRSSTGAGILKGKFAYMAPEQARRDEIDRRADIFAAGAVLWELLAGRRLIEGGSPADVLRTLLAGNLPRIASVREDIDPKLLAILDRALQMGVDARYPTAQAMREHLEDYVASTGRPVRSEELGQLVSERFAEHRASIQSMIQSCVAASDAERPSQLPVLAGNAGASDFPLLQAVSTPLDSDRVHDVRVDSGSSSQPSWVDRPTDHGRPPRSRSRVTPIAMLFLALVVLGSAALYAFVVRRSAGHDERPSSVAPTAAIVVSSPAQPLELVAPTAVPTERPEEEPRPSVRSPSLSQQKPGQAPSKHGVRAPTAGTDTANHIASAPPQFAAPVGSRAGGTATATATATGKTETKVRVPLLVDRPQVELVE